MPGELRETDQDTRKKNTIAREVFDNVKGKASDVYVIENPKFRNYIMYKARELSKARKNLSQSHP